MAQPRSRSPAATQPVDKKKEVSTKGASGDGDPKAPSTLVIVLLTAGWYLSSMCAIITSKSTMQALPAPLCLCTAQFLTATVTSRILLAMSGAASGIRRPEAPMLGATALTYTLGFFFTNLAFSLAHASFVETVKSGEPISTVILAYFLLGEAERFGTYASLVPVTIGVAMASIGEAGGSFAAVLVTIASNFGFSARAVFAKNIKRDHPSSPCAQSDICLFYNISWTGLLALLPLAVLTEGPKVLAAASAEDFPLARVALTMALNGVMYTAYNQLSFMVLSRVSTATHAVLNVCRRTCVIGATTVAFGTPLSALNAAGLALALVGFAGYTRCKTAVVPAATAKTKKSD